MVTIKDIARRLKISPSSVSRALNAKDGVGNELRKKVRITAQELGYHPDSKAKALIGGKVGVIGIIIPRSVEYSFSNAYYPLILEGICKQCRLLNYHVLLSFEGMESYSELYLRRLVDGVIVCANRIGDEKIDDLEMRSIPTCLIPGYPSDINSSLPSVDAEHEHSTYQAVSHLIECGHTRIAFILGALNSKYSIDRLKGYKKALLDNGIEYIDTYTRVSDFTRQAGYLIMKQLLKIAIPPTAVLCTNDVVTLGAIQAIQKHNWKIPDDISVISIGDTVYTRSVLPELTVIRVPYQTIGERASELLIKTINAVTILNKRIVLPSKFLIKKTTGSPKRQILKEGGEMFS